MMTGGAFSKATLFALSVTPYITATIVMQLSLIHIYIKPGNALPMTNIPVGTFIHNVELHPGKGAQLARSAGIMAQLMAKEGAYALKMCIRDRAISDRKISGISAGDFEQKPVCSEESLWL